TPSVTSIARAIYAERRFADMPILADALEEASPASVIFALPTYRFCTLLTPARFLRPLSVTRQVTDAGLKELSAFRKLTFLDLSFTEITDDGLKHLAGLNGLAELNLIGAAKVTDKGITALQRALPNCRIAR